MDSPCRFRFVFSLQELAGACRKSIRIQPEELQIFEEGNQGFDVKTQEKHRNKLDQEKERKIGLRESFESFTRNKTTVAAENCAGGKERNDHYGRRRTVAKISNNCKTKKNKKHFPLCCFFLVTTARLQCHQMKINDSRSPFAQLYQHPLPPTQKCKNWDTLSHVRLAQFANEKGMQMRGSRKL